MHRVLGLIILVCVITDTGEGGLTAECIEKIWAALYWHSGEVNSKTAHSRRSGFPERDTQISAVTLFNSINATWQDMLFIKSHGLFTRAQIRKHPTWCRHAKQTTAGRLSLSQRQHLINTSPLIMLNAKFQTRRAGGREPWCRQPSTTVSETRLFD